MPTPQETRVLIVGGGFGGIAAALTLEKYKIAGLKITLVSDKPHFEYHAALYRVVTGKSPLEVCIPISQILAHTKIEFVVDSIERVDCQGNVAYGSSGSRYPFHYVVLALGSETAYFNIPGLKEFSFGFRSIPEALRLKRHLHQEFESCVNPQETTEQKVCLLHFVVVGAGASGVELAGELAAYTKELARHHGIEQTLITIDLIEAAPRILPAFPANASQRIEQRLRQVGVNIFTNRQMVEEELHEIKLRGMTMKTETVIWTAGIKPNTLFKGIAGLIFDQKGRVSVDEYLRAQGFQHIFVIGDGASTPYSGMAQTAVHNGKAAGENIMLSFQKKNLKKYIPQKPFYSIPVGPGWAATLMGPLQFFGFLGWFFRRAADLRYFLSILPPAKAIAAFSSGKALCETCAVCLPEN